MEDKKIDVEKVKKLYDDMSVIWPEDDKWYTYTYKRIHAFLKKWEKKLNISDKTHILNAGSGGNSYGIKGKHIHLDITSKHINANQDYVIASIEDIPFKDCSFDVCICVGSVINYCDALTGISEISRTLKAGGYLILEFDQSRCYEYLGTPTYGANLDIVRTFNSGFEDKIWVYSEKYINSILKLHNYDILNKQYFHTLSSLAYKLLSNEQKAAKYVCLDKIINLFPRIRKVSNNIILIAQKASK